MTYTNIKGHVCVNVCVCVSINIKVYTAQNLLPEIWIATLPPT